MGKVRALRARVHRAAVRPDGEAAPGPVPRALEPALPQVSAGGAGAKDWAFVHNDIFARTQIDPSALVQRLELDQKSVVSLKRGAEPKAILPKKEKLKLRRERWLQKIEAIKLAEQKLREERKRKAMVVVGDLHPLRDALPELQELEASRQQQQARREEERTRFQKLLASPAYRASPLLAIGQQLAHQMQLEGGEHL
uniref:protein FAM207A isoform X2 n=1 Tax=Arvicanthis niloticus TaxID=61156 RepID=UPI0014860E18|nr:protein FAM207A isoform X2 [Arvicanthis niloticus]